MSSSEYSDMVVTRDELARATIEHIAATVSFYKGSLEWCWPDSEHFIPDMIKREQMLEGSLARINTCLRQLGGIRHSITDTGTGRETLCNFYQLASIDPVKDELKWHITGQYPVKGTVSVGYDLIPELRDKF